MGRPRKQEIELTQAERRELDGLARSRTAPHGLVRRARIVLASADRRSDTEIARRHGLSIPAVAHWRKRFLELGPVGLCGERRPGRPRARGDEEVAALLAKVLRERPADGTHWTVRMAGAATGMPKSTVQRYLALFGVRPHRPKGFGLSPDPLFVDKVRGIVGLYLNPPDKAVVLCVDEKSRIQALERTQPAIPGGPGEPERVSHDHRRHGTATLFAALDVADGRVTAECRARHRHQEFLAFLERIDAEVPAGLDVHLVVDSCCTHKHAKVRAWLAARPRFHVRFTPTYASWLNQAGRWFGIITRREIRRGSFRSTGELVRRIEAFVATYNARSRPFTWAATADQTLGKVARLCKVVNGTAH